MKLQVFSPVFCLEHMLNHEVQMPHSSVVPPASTPEVLAFLGEEPDADAAASMTCWVMFQGSQISSPIRCLSPRHPSLTPVLQCLQVPREG